MAKKKILYIAPEIYPYLPESYTSHICRYLPQGIQECDNEIRTFMPKFGCINERKNQLHEVIRLSGQNIIVDSTDHPLIIKVASLQVVRMQIYFIDSEDYFKRKQLYYDLEGNFFEDNDERMIFFAKGVVETVRKLGWAPDIIHCHGFISALVPLFIKTYYKDDPLFQDSRIVYSIYNDSFPGLLDANLMKKLINTGVHEKYLAHYNTPNYLTLMQLASDFSDAIILCEENTEPSVLDMFNHYPRLHFVHPQTEQYVDEYNNFYDQLLQQPNVIF